MRPDHRRRVVLGAAALAASVVAACREQPQANTTANAAADEGAPQAPALPVAEPPLDREELLLAIARAASAYALGADDSQAQRTMDGRRFEVRLRFGCGGPERVEDEPGWTFDPDTKVLRVRVQPDLSLDDPAVQALAGDDVEAVEGFWLKRPWMLAAGCPRTAVSAPATGSPTATPPNERAAAPGPAPQGQRVGIAQFFTPADSRTRRRSNRPFEAIRTLNVGQEAASQGFDLVLLGRLKALSGGRVIACASRQHERAPDCVVSADIDRVRLERAEDREVVAEWGVS